MAGFDETTLRELTWDQLKAVARENGVRVSQKREKITGELLQLGRPKMTQLAKLQGDKTTVKMEKIRRRTLGHVKTPPRPASSRGRRATRASTSRRASAPKSVPEPECAPQPEAAANLEAAAQPPQPAVVEALASVAAAVEGQVEVDANAKPEELRPLDRARARYRLEKEQAKREKHAKEKEEEAARVEVQPPSAATSVQAAEVPDKDTPYSGQIRSPRKRVLYRVGEPMPDEPPPKPRARTPGPRRDDWPGDEWRVGLLSPDPNNLLPVFSPPAKPRDEPAKEKEEGQPVAPKSQEKEQEKESSQLAAPVPGEEIECALVADEQEQEQVSGEDTDTESAEEDEVFEMTSMDNIRVTLPEDKAADCVGRGDKTMRQKRKAEDEDNEEGEHEKTITARDQSPKKRRRIGLRGLLSKVF